METPIAILVAIAIIGAGASVYCVEEEYLPVDLETMPTEFGTKIDTSEYEQTYSDILSEIPNIDKIEHDVYLTTEDQIEVINYYKREITESGYTYLQDYSGEYTVETTPLTVLVFQKGASVIAIGIAQSKHLGLEKETAIIYTTGAIWVYEDVLTWYRNQYE